MRGALAAVVLATVIGWNAGSFSQQSHPSPGEAIQPQEPPSASPENPPIQAQRGTEQTPIIIQLAPTPKTEAETHQEAEDRQEKMSNDRNLVEFTEYLVIATTVLAAIGGLQLIVFGLQARRLRQTVAATEEATDLARKQFVAANRPKIRIKHVWLKSEIWNGEKVVIDLIFVNQGLTDAELTACEVGVLVYESNRLLPQPPPTDLMQHFLPTNRTVQSGLTFHIPNLEAAEKLTDAHSVSIREGTSKLYCFGAIEYRDNDSRIRKTAFCRYLKVPSCQRTYQDVGRFEKHDDPDYEYED